MGLYNILSENLPTKTVVAMRRKRLDTTLL
jgi:hypothetical protein